MDLLLNDCWKFRKMPAGSKIRETGDPSAWQDVDLPHDWLIWQESNLYETADAWYYRELNLPADRPPVCLLRFDGVYMDCDVWLNGEVICSHAYGYTAFTADLTEKRLPGKMKSGCISVIRARIRDGIPAAASSGM